MFGVFNALGTVAFAYGGHNVILEIQVRFGAAFSLSFMQCTLQCTLMQQQELSLTACSSACIVLAAANVLSTFCTAPVSTTQHTSCEWTWHKQTHTHMGWLTVAIHLSQSLSSERPPLQATLPSKPNRNTSVPMMRGVYVAYAVVSWCYFGVSCAGYWAFGNNVQSNVIFSIGHPKWMVAMADLFVTVHVIGSYQVRTLSLSLYNLSTNNSTNNESANRNDLPTSLCWQLVRCR